jgi:zinc transport system substrate-binding protein
MRKLLIFVLACLGACTEHEKADTLLEAGSKTPVVIATNYPLYFFTQQLAGGAVDVRFPDIAGDPAFWTPDGNEAAALQTADLIVFNGAGYEAWLSFVTLREDRLLDTTAELADRLLPIEEINVHQHGPGGEHSHKGTAFTTWLNPQLAIEQARTIERALSALAPEHADDFNVRLAQLETRLQELDRSLQQTFEAWQGRPVVFSHPVYQYLQHRYGINGRSLHWEPDANPGVRAWIDFHNLLREHPATLMIWEDLPRKETASRLEEMGIASVVFLVAGNRPEIGDYMTVMEDNIQRLLLAIGSQAR